MPQRRSAALLCGGTPSAAAKIHRWAKPASTRRHTFAVHEQAQAAPDSSSEGTIGLSPATYDRRVGRATDLLEPPPPGEHQHGEVQQLGPARLAAGTPVDSDADLALTSPLVRRHINPYGRYHFDLTRLERARPPEGSAGA